MIKLLLYCLMAGGFVVVTTAHSYHLGACPIVEPMHDFDMNRFLGVWYVIQKTSTASKCIIYNYTRSEEPRHYLITQDSDHPVLGLTPLKHEYHYTGELSVPELSTPARMEVNFPLNVAGKASHVVFDTDYDTYAGLFSCQKLAFAHRQSATILSRRRDLDVQIITNLRKRLSLFGVDPYDLSIITQMECPHGNQSLDINIDPNTFTAENFGNAVRKAGEKIGDGVEWVANASSKLYHKIKGDEEENKSKSTSRTIGYPESETNKGFDHTKLMKSDTNEVEWIP